MQRRARQSGGLGGAAGGVSRVLARPGSGSFAITNSVTEFTVGTYS